MKQSKEYRNELKERVEKAFLRIKSLEKDFSDFIISSACNRYSLIQRERKKAEKEIRKAKERLEEALQYEKNLK